MMRSHLFSSLRHSLPFVVATSATLIAGMFSCVQAEEPLQFNRDIRPLLAQACFRCHGFDSKTREAGLRLDSAEEALAARPDGGQPIVPGNPEESLIWKRILTSDPDEVMPPPSANRQLSAEEKELLARWIREGAKFEKHWAFEPIPAPNNDFNLDEELKKEAVRHSLSLTDLADPVSRVRRLSFTLTGLPPEPSDIESFVKDPSTSNYELLVDRYLASPHYGEEMAKHWLDLARYGDTHGLHLDNERTMWAYRDWVVQAFNRNQPYDEFTIDQIAGDLRPNPTIDQLVATGFNRCNVTTSEGGAINEEFLFRYAVDRTSTTVQTWLGLTAGCAVCHDHKYDPLTTKEFYSLYSFFYSAADPAMDGNVDNTSPFQRLSPNGLHQRWEDARARESEAHSVVLKIADSFDRRSPLNVQLGGKDAASAPVTRVWIDDELPLQSSSRNTSRNGEIWNSDATAPMGQRYLHQEFGDRFEETVSGGWPAMVIPQGGKLQFWVRPDRFETPQAITVHLRAGAKSKRWIWANSKEQARQIHGDESMLAGSIPKPGQWSLVSVPLDDLPADTPLQEIQFGLFQGVCDWDGFAFSGVFHDEPNMEFDAWWTLQKGKSLPFATGDLATALKDGPESEIGKRLRPQVESFFFAYVARDVSPELELARHEWERARTTRLMMESQNPGTFVFKDLPTPREAFVMTRGQYDAKGEPVHPDTPAILPKLSIEEGKRANRLDLAKWIVSAENPLTARVAANRLWQQVFGVGLVKTSEDFGTQGASPTHPYLLDALAHDFRANAWDVKRLVKKLVMSEAFQRSPEIREKDYAIDPENKYLARGPRIRLDAEQIRDNVLAVSGLLHREMGGKGFKTYQPPNIWEPVGYGDSNTRYYIQDHGDTIYRRSIYAYLKRTAPPPFLTNFDAPNREQFCSRRDRSNTPLQALQLMNDIQYMEAARHFAERVEQNGGEQFTDKVQYLVRQALGRNPTPNEMSALTNAYFRFRIRLEKAPDDAQRIASLGEKPRRPGLSNLDLASWTLLANAVFNLDEFVNRN